MISCDTIGLSYTRTCPVACRHCITESSPYTFGKMIPEEATHYIRSSKEAELAGICFTGGEPFIYYSEILPLVGFANQLGLDTTIMTSGIWATSSQRTINMIEELAQLGLKSLGLSWGPFHQEFIPLERPLRAARIALEHGINVSVRTVIAAGQSGERFQEAFESVPGIQLERPCSVTKLGRATSLPDHAFQRIETPPEGFCYSLTLPVIDYDGLVYACCGPSLHSQRPSPLVLGNAKDEALARILQRAKNDPLLECIAFWGPYGLYTLLRDSGHERLCQLRDYYTSICELCLDLTGSPEVMSIAQRLLQMPPLRRRLAATGLVFSKRIYPEVAADRYRRDFHCTLTDQEGCLGSPCNGGSNASTS